MCVSLCMSGSPGSSTPSSTTSGLNPERSPPSLEAKVSPAPPHSIFCIRLCFCTTDPLMSLPADLQMVNIALRVLSRPLASNLPVLYQQLGQDYDERVLPSIVNEVLKSVVAKFNASQLITQRAQVHSRRCRPGGDVRSAVSEIASNCLYSHYLSYTAAKWCPNPA